MEKTVNIIELSWQGPFGMNEVRKLNKDCDRGVYQIYGTHPIFGPDSLLYIGKTQKSKFAGEICNGHGDWIKWETNPSIYVGRLGGSETPIDATWSNMIDIAERLLIYYSAPPYNSQNLGSYGEKIKSTIVINYRCRNMLPGVVTSLEDETEIESTKWKEFGCDKSCRGKSCHAT